jgi:tripartite-type tricarboxylate transporter receptor subunit TctC
MRRWTFAGTLLLIIWNASAAWAQQFPSKPIRFIIPFPPGGPTDIVGRMAVDTLARALGTPVIADNRPGAGGIIGSELCAKAPPDGHTMCMMTNAQTIAPSLYPKVTFNVVRDFSHVSLMAVLPQLLLVHPSVPARNVRALIALARARPGMLTYASTGNGTGTHVIMEMFKMQSGVQIVHVPYKGASPAMIDQMSGRIDVAFSSAIAALPFVKQGRVRALAVSTLDRFPPLPELPPVAEAGLPGFDGSSWQGVSMPAGVARDIVIRVNGELAKMLQAPDSRDKILTMGGIPKSPTPDQFTAFVKADVEKWAQVVKAARVKVD